MLSLILFKLVVLRTYLDRPPENDLDIFDLVKDGKVSRIWTVHEQALAACASEEDMSTNAKYAVPVISPSIWRVKVVNNKKITFQRALVSLDASIVWSERPGLVGGDQRPHHYLPPHL